MFRFAFSPNDVTLWRLDVRLACRWAAGAQNRLDRLPDLADILDFFDF